MAYVDITRLRGRVRVTRRVLSRPDDRGDQRVLAGAGEVVSLEEAYRRRLPEDALEPEGRAGTAAVDALKGPDGRLSWARLEHEAIARAEAAARDIDRQEQRAAERDRAQAQRRRAGETPPQSPPAGDGDGDGAADGDGDGDGDGYPRHRGGPVWELSDGSTVRGKREDAEKAQAQLAAADDDTAPGEGQEPSGDGPPAPAGDGDGEDAGS